MLNIFKKIFQKDESAEQKPEEGLNQQEQNVDETIVPQESEIKTEEPAESQESEIKTEEPAESQESEIKTEEPAESQESEIKTEEPAESQESEIKTEEPAESQESEIKTNLDETLPTVEEQEKKPFWGISFSSLKDKISKTSEALIDNVVTLASGQEELDDDVLDEMEERLIKADLGLDTAVEIVNKLRAKKNRIKPSEVKDFLREEFAAILSSAGSTSLNLKSNELSIILITGVNGAGKTTLIGKLAYRYKQQGKKVLVAAGDTFRAAAEDQLEIWTHRAGADIVRKDGADPASVVFDAIKQATGDGYDILLVDTAGRLQNKINLMEELRKIKKIIDREAGANLTESMLVLDATTGQNGLKQAEVFKESVQLTSVALTKLDGTAKGGIVVSVARTLGLPVKLIGVGEKIQDLKDFNSDDFINALFS